MLALILDLDETLVVAHTASTAEARRDECLRAKENMLEAAARTLNMDSPEDRQHLESSMNCLQKEAELLAFDAELLTQYATSNSVRIQARMFTPRPETVVLEDGTSIQRPVIRLKDGQIILTRINPSDRRSSVLIRIRPGWKELHNLLAGLQDAKHRFDVYVCTAAERQYALEVWRQLDPSTALIPLPVRKQRLVNVAGGRLKTLPNALGLLPHGEEAPVVPVAVPGAVVPPLPIVEPPAVHDASRQLPLAVIVDDRTVVWEPASRPHILQVIAWTHYRDEAARQLRVDTHSSAASERELTRVRNAIMQLRGDTYRSIAETVTPVMAGIASQGYKTATQCSAGVQGAGAQGSAQHTLISEVPPPVAGGLLLPPVQGTDVRLQDPNKVPLYAMPASNAPLYEAPIVPPTCATPPLPPLIPPTAINNSSRTSIDANTNTTTTIAAEAAAAPPQHTAPQQPPINASIPSTTAPPSEKPAAQPSSLTAPPPAVASRSSFERQTSNAAAAASTAGLIGTASGAGKTDAAAPKAAGPSTTAAAPAQPKPPSNPPSRGVSIQPPAVPRPTIKDVSAWSLDAMMAGGGDEDEEEEMGEGNDRNEEGMGDEDVKEDQGVQGANGSDDKQQQGEGVKEAAEVAEAAPTAAEPALQPLAAEVAEAAPTAAEPASQPPASFSWVPGLINTWVPSQPSPMKTDRTSQSPSPSPSPSPSSSPSRSPSPPPQRAARSKSAATASNATKKAAAVPAKKAATATKSTKSAPKEPQKQQAKPRPSKQQRKGSPEESSDHSAPSSSHSSSDDDDDADSPPTASTNPSRGSVPTSRQQQLHKQEQQQQKQKTSQQQQKGKGGRVKGGVAKVQPKTKKKVVKKDESSEGEDAQQESSSEQEEQESSEEAEPPKKKRCPPAGPQSKQQGNKGGTGAAASKKGGATTAPPDPATMKSSQERAQKFGLLNKLQEGSKAKSGAGPSSPRQPPSQQQKQEKEKPAAATKKRGRPASKK